MRDIRKAIKADFLSDGAGSLGTICVHVDIDEPPDTDDGYLSLQGFGFFDQRIRIEISGDMEDL